MLSSNHGFIYYVAIIAAGVMSANYVRSKDNPDVFNKKIMAAIPEADSITVEEIPLDEFQNLRGVNRGYDRAVNTDPFPII